MATKVPAKSILRQPTNTTEPSISDEEQAKLDRDRRNLGLALYHANKIQAQKDAEAAILDIIEKLLDYPSGSTYTALEASTFRTLVVPFQPSDFSSLIEERRIDGKCGYVLCSNEPRAKTMGSNAAWRLKGQGAADYCSNVCLRKALYVQAQLSEIPAWERQPGQEPEIALPLDDRPQSDSVASQERFQASQRSLQESQNLALERGEDPSSFRPNQVMHDRIVEKRTTLSQPVAHPSAIETSHDSIEGHVPTQRPTSVITDARASIKTPARSVVNQNDKLATMNQQRTEADDEEESWSALYDNLSAG